MMYTMVILTQNKASFSGAIFLKEFSKDFDEKKLNHNHDAVKLLRLESGPSKLFLDPCSIGERRKNTYSAPMTIFCIMRLV